MYTMTNNAGETFEHETTAELRAELLQGIWREPCLRACMNEIANGSFGECRGPDGGLRLLEITVKVRNRVPSPEETGEYPPCPSCGEDREYKGVDDKCGASQRFTARPGQPQYGTYEPFDIGPYTEIRCGSCDALIWTEYLA